MKPPLLPQSIFSQSESLERLATEGLISHRRSGMAVGAGWQHQTNATKINQMRSDGEGKERGKATQKEKEKEGMKR
jgi:hypothetical protein